MTGTSENSIHTPRSASLLNDILTNVSEVTEVDIDDIRGSSRRREYVMARQLYCILAHELTGTSLASVGSLINRDHSTVIYLITQFQHARYMDDFWSRFLMNTYREVKERMGYE